MRRILPGTKPPKVPGIFNLSDILPDPRRPAIRDVAQRNIYLHGALVSNHTTLSVSDEQAAETDGLPQRLRSVEVQGVSGGTVTVQVTVAGRDAFDDAVRPVSDAGPSEVTDIYVFPPGQEVHSIIEATSGTPTGTANVLIETEPYVLLGRFQPIELQGKDRLFPSRRRTARYLNTNTAPPGAEQVSRLYAYSFGGVSPLLAESSTLYRPILGGGTAEDVSTIRTTVRVPPTPISSFTPSSPDGDNTSHVL